MAKLAGVFAPKWPVYHPLSPPGWVKARLSGAARFRKRRARVGKRWFNSSRLKQAGRVAGKIWPAPKPPMASRRAYETPKSIASDLKAKKPQLDDYTIDTSTVVQWCLMRSSRSRTTFRSQFTDIPPLAKLRRPWVACAANIAGQHATLAPLCRTSGSIFDHPGPWCPW